MKRARRLAGLAGGVRVVGSLAAQAARHALWYIQYQTQGTSHDAPRPRRRSDRS